MLISLYNKTQLKTFSKNIVNNKPTSVKTVMSLITSISTEEHILDIDCVDDRHHI